MMVGSQSEVVLVCTCVRMYVRMYVGVFVCICMCVCWMLLSKQNFELK